MFNLNFILYLLIVFSLIGLGIIVYRKIPLLARLSEEEMIILKRKKGVIQKLREINYKQHWLDLIIHLEKFLRRIKIIFLKIENLLSKWINGLRRMSQIMNFVEEDKDISISELKKPIKEEQKWIDLIVENPKNITAYKFLGFLYWKQHNYTDAKASLEMAVKLGSKDKKVKEVLRELKKMGVKNGK